MLLDEMRAAVQQSEALARALFGAWLDEAAAAGLTISG